MLIDHDRWRKGLIIITAGLALAGMMARRCTPAPFEMLDGVAQLLLVPYLRDHWPSLLALGRFCTCYGAVALGLLVGLSYGCYRCGYRVAAGWFLLTQVLASGVVAPLLSGVATLTVTPHWSVNWLISPAVTLWFGLLALIAQLLANLPLRGGVQVIIVVIMTALGLAVGAAVLASGLSLTGSLLTLLVSYLCWLISCQWYYQQAPALVKQWRLSSRL